MLLGMHVLNSFLWFRIIIVGGLDRMAIGFYALGSLDLLGTVNTAVTEVDRQAWSNWVWEQQSSTNAI